MIQEKGTVLLGHGELASDTDDESRDAGRARVTFWCLLRPVLE